MSAEPTISTNPVTEHPRAITARAVLLGFLTIAVNTVYLDHHGGNLVKSYLPVAVLIPFLAWVVINTLLKLWAPRLALARGEVLTILSMLWIGGNLPAIGWGQHAISLVPAPEFYASPENRLRDAIIPHLPRFLFLDVADPRVHNVYTGLPPGDTLPWQLWFRPLFWWLVGCLAAVAAGLFGTVLFFRQWAEQERLVFPMATFPVAMLETGSGHRTPDVFRDRIFWIGVACTAGVIAWNIAGYFIIALPRITLFDNYLSKTIHLGRYYPPFYLRVQPLLMGLAYLCPTDILFSFWFYNLLNTLKIGALNRTGFTVGLEGQPAKAGEIAMLESNGALVMLVAWSVWISRRHLRDTLRQALGPRASDTGAPVTYRTAWLGWGVSVLILGGWFHAVGLSPVATVLQLVFLFICYFGITKYAATTGFTFLNPAGGKGYAVLRSIGGSHNLTPSSQSMMVLIGRNIFLGAPLRTTSIPSIAHIFKMFGEALHRHRRIWILLLLAYIIGYAIATGSRLERSYTDGGLNTGLVSWAMDDLINNIPFIEGTKAYAFDTQKLAVWLFGAGEAALLTALRARYAWWPIHPVAIAFPERRYAFCLFLVWVAKSLTLRLGGVSLYRRSLPWWYGAVCGYLLGVAVSSVVDAVFFPDGGHFVHGW